ncbi:HAD family hydrolase [Halorubrum lacusprofundi]|jgi:capsule biosynthesis phosphatase|uniref:capsular biosynthesis protein n=1 Tax=Halorubrum lacusprofundi TaxID=2247 RepID=UPI000B5A3483|nr:capsular biosynthesis protein [Halorubrum lacusprofundi]MCG1007641.1 capsular biosynthesis protein [Halorubrum lacusprofundi]
MKENKRIVMDVDGVLAKKDDGAYLDKEADEEVIEQLRQYEREGFYIILNTARNMRTHEGRIGKINAETAPVLLEWLDEKEVPYDEIHLGKPWCGHEGFYVDDKALRPSEFLSMEHEEIQAMLKKEER